MYPQAVPGSHRRIGLCVSLGSCGWRAVCLSWQFRKDVCRPIVEAHVRGKLAASTPGQASPSNRSWALDLLRENGCHLSCRNIGKGDHGVGRCTCYSARCCLSNRGGLKRSLLFARTVSSLLDTKAILSSVIPRDTLTLIYRGYSPTSIR